MKEGFLKKISAVFVVGTASVAVILGLYAVCVAIVFIAFYYLMHMSLSASLIISLVGGFIVLQIADYLYDAFSPKKNRVKKE